MKPGEWRPYYTTCTAPREPRVPLEKEPRTARGSGPSHSSPHEPPQPPTCSVCGKFPRPGEKIKRCSACKSVLYCGRECQEADWKAGHKDKCKGMQMERERAAALAANPLPPPAAAPLKQVKGRGGKWRVKRELTPQTRDLYPGMPAPPAPAPAPAKPLSNDDFRKMLQGGGDGPAVKRRRY